MRKGRQSPFRLLNIDCQSAMKDIEAGSVDCIVTDPPYGVEYAQDFYDDSADSVLAMMPAWFEQWHRILTDDSYLFLFVGVKNIERWISCGKEAGFDFRNIIATRAFNNGMKLKRNFAFVLQPVLLFCKGRGRDFNEVDFFPTSEAWLNDSRNAKKEKYQYQYPNFVLPSVAFGTESFGGNEKKEIVHPNAKSEPLCRFFVEIATNKGDTVLDCFMGSGTVGAACMNSERRFIGIEKDKRYFNAARRRILDANPLFNQF